MKLSTPDMKQMTFNSEYTDFEIYVSKLGGSYYYGHYPHEYLSIWYNGSYEYLDINYYEIEKFYHKNGWIKEASCHVKIYDKGWNHFNTTFEQENWVA